MKRISYVFGTLLLLVTLALAKPGLPEMIDFLLRFVDYTNEYTIQNTSSINMAKVYMNDNDAMDVIFFRSGTAHAFLNDYDSTLTHQSYTFETGTSRHLGSPTGNAVIAKANYNKIKIYDVVTNGFNTPPNYDATKVYQTSSLGVFTTGDLSTTDSYDIAYSDHSNVKTLVMPADDAFEVSATNDTTYVGDSFLVETGATIMQILAADFNDDGKDELAVLYYVYSSSSNTANYKIKFYTVSQRISREGYDYVLNATLNVASSLTTDLISNNQSIHAANINGDRYLDLVYNNNLLVRPFYFRPIVSGSDHAYFAASSDKVHYHSLTADNYPKTIYFTDMKKNGRDDMVTASNKQIGFTSNTITNDLGNDNADISYFRSDFLSLNVNTTRIPFLTSIDFHGRGTQSFVTCILQGYNSNAFVNVWECAQNTPSLPPENLTFEWSMSGSNIPLLSWDPVDEVDLINYKIYRKYPNGNWTYVGYTNTSTTQFEDDSYTVPPNLNSVGTAYRVYAYDGLYSYSSVSLPIGYKKDPTMDNDLPFDFALNNVYPNPFNPTGTVEFSVPEISNVSITMYNVLGQRVLEVLNKEMQPGIHNVIIDGSNLTSGTYFLRMKAADFTASKKVLLMK